MHYITLSTQQEMTKVLPEVWSILNVAYANVKGGLHFSSPQDLLTQSYCWKLTFKDGNIIALSVFKNKQGLKLVAMATNPEFKEEGRKSLIKMIQSVLNYAWMELSESAERFVLKHCGGYKFVLNADYAHSLLGKDAIYSSDRDSYHYKRWIQNILKEKIIVGTPQYL